jgi:hypothetical protein
MPTFEKISNASGPSLAALKERTGICIVADCLLPAELLALGVVAPRPTKRMDMHFQDFAWPVGRGILSVRVFEQLNSAALEGPEKLLQSLGLGRVEGFHAQPGRGRGAASP